MKFNFKRSWGQLDSFKISSLLHRWPHLAAILVLFLCSLRIILQIKEYLLIDISDEFYYIDRALQNIRTFSIPSPDWGPLYSLWYFFLSLFISDYLDIYFANMAIQTVALPLLVYVLLGRSKVPPLISFLTAFYVLSLEANLLFARRPHHFMLVIVLIFFILRSFLKEKKQVLFLLTVTSLLVSYIRPELFSGFCLALFIFLISSIIDLRVAKTRVSLLIYSITLISVCAALITFFGGPPIDWAPHAKALYSFKDYTYFTYQVLHPENTLSITDTFQKIFGDVNSVPEAIFSAPGFMFTHVTYNLSQVTPLFYKLFSRNFLIPGALAFVLWILFLSFHVFRNLKEKSWFKLNKQKTLLTVLCLVVFITPTFVSLSLYGVLDRYLFPTTILVFVHLLILLTSQTKIPSSYGLVTLAILLPFALHLGPEKVISAHSYIPSGSNNYRALSAIRGLRLQGEILLLSKEGFVHNALGANFDSLNIYNSFMRSFDQEGKINEARRLKFTKFLERKQIHLIWVDDEFKWKLRHWLNDKELIRDFDEFIYHPERWGYISYPVSGSSSTLLIQRDVISRRPPPHLISNP